MSSVYKEGNIEIGEDDEIPLLLAKYCLECELCFKENDNQMIQKNTPDIREIRLISAKVISNGKSKKTYIVVCDKHHQIIETLIDKRFSVIQYSVNQLDIKKAKLIKIRNINLLQALQQIQNNYCCRILKFRYSNIEKQIQRLNHDNQEEIIKSACEQKKKNLELTKIKFQFYVENKEKMILKQKLLIYHFYKRLEAKTYQKIDNFKLEQQNIDTISLSMSVPLSSQFFKD
ncbi:unnamed protein product [Paramecium sonneborni]|uniref:Uncharacterized protein n=1 Tax=Paramecium sonneborni TaxID=65129 RepID=A0A8S1N7K1_9CILI|nr:unnamed protein product [Paramecium sonneborni]